MQLAWEIFTFFGDRFMCVFVCVVGLLFYLKTILCRFSLANLSY